MNVFVVVVAVFDVLEEEVVVVMEMVDFVVVDCEEDVVLKEIVLVEVSDVVDIVEVVADVDEDVIEEEVKDEVDEDEEEVDIDEEVIVEVVEVFVVVVSVFVVVVLVLVVVVLVVLLSAHNFFPCDVQAKELTSQPLVLDCPDALLSP